MEQTDVDAHSNVPAEEAKKLADNLLPDLKAKLERADGVSDASLRKFLHWKPNLDRAAGRFNAHVKWRKEVPFVFDEQPPLMASKDDNLKRCLESEVLIAPDGLVANNNGSTVMIGRLRNNDMSDGRTVEDIVRMFLYNIDRILERESTQLHGVTVFHDLKGVSRNNLHLGVPRVLFHAIIGHFPIRISQVLILNAPLFFKALFSVVSLGMPAKIRKRVHFVNDIQAVYDVIGKDKLLVEHGGQLEHDQKEWVAKHMQRELDGTIESLKDCVPP